MPGDGFEIARAYVTVSPDASNFEEELREQIGDPQVTVTVGADAQPAEAEVDDLQARIDDLGAVVDINADAAEADAQVGELQARLDSLSGDNVTVGANTQPALTEVDGLQARVDGLSGTAEIGADTAAADAKVDELQARLDAMSGASVDINADTIPADDSISKLEARVDSLDGTTVTIGADTGPADEALGRLEADVDSLDGTTLTVGADTADAQSKLDGIREQLVTLEDSFAELHVGVDDTEAQAKIQAISDEMDVLEAKSAQLFVQVHTEGVPEDIAELGALSAAIAALQAQIDSLGGGGGLADLGRAAEELTGSLDSAGGSVDDLASRTAYLSDMAAAAQERLNNFDNDLAGTGSAAASMGSFLDAASQDVQDLNDRFSLVNNELREFDQVAGGADISTTGLHNDMQSLGQAIDEVQARGGTYAASLEDMNQQLDGVADGLNNAEARFGEFAAAGEVTAADASQWGDRYAGVASELDQVAAGADNAGGSLNKLQQEGENNGGGGGGGFMGMLLGAAVALGPAFITAAAGAALFAGAAIPTIRDIAKDTKAYHDQLEGLKSEYMAVADAVKPEVLTAWDDALSAAKTILPEFTSAAIAGGKGVDSFLAQFEAFLGSGDTKQFLSFVGANTQGDMHAFANALQGIGTFIYGFAESLNSISKAILNTIGGLASFGGEVLKEVPWLAQWAVGIGAMYLATEKIPEVLSAIVASNFGEWLIGGKAGLESMVVAFRSVTSATDAFEAAQIALGEINPFVWVAAAVVGLGALAGVIAKEKSPVDDLARALENQYHATGLNVAGYDNLASALSTAQGRQAAVTGAIKDGSVAAGGLYGNLGAVKTAYQQVGVAEQQASTAGNTLWNALASLSTKYNITMSQAQQDVAQYAQANHISMATVTKDLTGGASAANAFVTKVEQWTDSEAGSHSASAALQQDLLAVSNTALSTQTRITALNNSYTAMVGNFVGEQQGFLNVRQGFLTLKQDSDAAHASMTGTNQASITLQESFYSQISTIEQAATAMLQNGDTTKQVTGYIGDQITKLSGLEGGSEQAKQAVSDLKTWEDKLSTSIQQQANYIDGQLINSLDNAIIKYGGVQTAVNKYAKALVDFGPKSAQATAAEDQMNLSVIKTGIAAGESTTQIAQMISKMDHIPLKEAIQIVLNAEGKWSVSESNVYPTPTGKPPPLKLGEKAAGGLIHGGEPGRDSVPIMAMPGELVVPTHLVDAGAVDHLRGKLPGFESGGIVGVYDGGSGNGYGGGASGMGSWADGEMDSTNSTIVNSVETAVADAVNAAISAAQAAAKSGGGHSGPGGGDPSKNEALAKSLFPWGGGQWQDYVNVVMAESGFNQFADNPGSGAYGIAQALPYTKYPKAGWPASAGGSSNPTAQITWMYSYIRQRYGDPAAAWAHESQYHWYDQGGVLPPGVTMAVNTTGRPETVVPNSANGIAVNFYGTTYPTPETIQALKLELMSAVSNAVG